jgi:hypothetical protein
VRHRLFTIASVMSLLLCAAGAVFWVRSYWVADVIVWQHPSCRGTLQSAPGAVVVQFNRSQWPSRYELVHEQVRPPTPADELTVSMRVLNINPGDTWIDSQHVGFAYLHWRGRGSQNSMSTAVVPFWSLTLLPALLPIMWAATHRQCVSRQSCAALCIVCGYNLTANTSGVCPECGRLLHVPIADTLAR